MKKKKLYDWCTVAEEHRKQCRKTAGVKTCKQCLKADKPEVKE